MSDIELVIKIPEGVYQHYKKVYQKSRGSIPESCIAFGEPLPKGHGRLGDLDKIKKEMQNYYDDCAKTSEYTRLGFETAISVVEDAHTIIEASEE